MSIETIEGIEDIQRDDENTLSEEKKFRIHLPIKQVSNSSYSSRRSSIAGLVEGKSNITEDYNKVSEKFKSFSVIKEKRKSKSSKQDPRKKTRRKTSGKKKTKQLRSEKIKAIDDPEDCESEPDVSEIILHNPKISVVIQEAETEADDSKLLSKEGMKTLMKKKRKKGKKKARLRKRRNVRAMCEPAARELERLLQEKDRLLQQELAKLDPKVAPSNPDSGFFPVPKSLEKRRCYFHRGAKALKCTICSGGEIKKQFYQRLIFFV